MHLVQGAEVCRRCCGCAVFAVGWKCDRDGEKEGTGSWLGQSRAGMQEPGYHQGLQGTPDPPRTQALISPHVCLAETAWGSRGGRLRELDSLLVPVPLLTLSPLAGREDNVPMELHVHVQGCKTALGVSGRSPLPLFRAPIGCLRGWPAVPALLPTDSCALLATCLVLLF